jgi:hypothetical protein
MNGRKVLLLELNEINWSVVDALVTMHGPAYLPNFARLKKEGAWGVQSAIEKPPMLDPWVTWVTLHTGVPAAVHGASVLEQDSTTISAKRLWHYVADAGRSVGVFGSISAYPPFKVRGFVVPGPFAPSDDTYPPNLRPIQAINRRYTQVHNKTVGAPNALENLKTGAKLMKLGLRTATGARVAAQLALERFAPHLRWRRVGLQPLMNFDFFAKLYRDQRPEFATWHSNHAAHYMHHYWRAWDDTKFPVKSSEAERAKYGDAVPYGYQLCDELIGRAINLLDADTVLVIGSSMGQQPFVSEKYQAGKIVVRIRDMDRFLSIVGREGVEKVVPTMVPQWNLTVSDEVQRNRLRQKIESIERLTGGTAEPGFSVSETGNCLTVTPLGLAEKPAGVRYRFPGEGTDPDHVFALDDLFATDTPTVKQGMHHVDGILVFFGAGIREGVQLPNCTNLDVAPTLLTMMGIDVPPVMEGRILSEASV